MTTSTPQQTMPCKVCGSRAPRTFTLSEEDCVLLEARFMANGYERSYFQCSECGLLFHAAFDALSTKQWSAVTNTGQGGRMDWIVNRGFREVQMVLQLMTLYGLPRNSRLLVFGCGPALSYNLLLQNGFDVWGSDQAPDFTEVREDMPPGLFDTQLIPEMLRRYWPLKALRPESWDIITLTEVFEHFLDPVKEMKRLASLVRPGGIVIGTTGWVDLTRDPLEDWWYVKAHTHTTFLSSEAFRRICNDAGCLGTLYPANEILIGKNTLSETQCVFVMQRPH